MAEVIWAGAAGTTPAIHTRGGRVMTAAYCHSCGAEDLLYEESTGEYFIMTAEEAEVIENIMRVGETLVEDEEERQFREERIKSRAVLEYLRGSLERLGGAQ